MIPAVASDNRRAELGSNGIERRSGEHSRALARFTDVGGQVFVAVSAVVAVVVAVFGSGAIGGTPIAEAAGGALAADATFAAPPGTAFAIWSVLYAGFLMLAAWQALPAQRDNVRLRYTGWLIGASLLLNAAWITAVQLGWLNASLAVIVALPAILAVIFWRCLRSRPSGRIDAVLLDGVLGLYLGWIVVATVANIAAALTAADVGDLGLGAQPWAVLVLAAAGIVGVTMAWIGGGRIAVSAGIIWGLGWIGLARIDSGPESSDLVDSKKPVELGVETLEELSPRHVTQLRRLAPRVLR